VNAALLKIRSQQFGAYFGIFLKNSLCIDKFGNFFLGLFKFKIQIKIKLSVHTVEMLNKLLKCVDCVCCGWDETRCERRGNRRINIYRLFRQRAAFGDRAGCLSAAAAGAHFHHKHALYITKLEEGGVV